MTRVKASKTAPINVAAASPVSSKRIAHRVRVHTRWRRSFSLRSSCSIAFYFTPARLRSSHHHLTLALLLTSSFLESTINPARLVAAAQGARSKTARARHLSKCDWCNSLVPHCSSLALQCSICRRSNKHMENKADCGSGLAAGFCFVFDNIYSRVWRLA